MAQAVNTHAPGGDTGFVVSTTAPNGTTFERGLIRAFALVDATGNEFGTPGNPLNIAGGGSGGGAVTIANGADVAEGNTADAAYAGTGSATVISLLKGSYGALIAPTPAGTNNIGSVNAIGNVASGAADSGNPVKVGGVYSTATSLTALTAGNRGDVQLDLYGNARSSITAWPLAPTSTTTVAGYLARTSSNSQAANLVALATMGGVFNGANIIPQPGDSNGAYSVVTPGSAAANALTRQFTTTASASLVVKASAGNLYGYSITSGASAGYLMIFDATTAPADGTVTPKIVRVIAANTTIETDRDISIRFTTGITMVFSTTGPFTKTASATAFLAGDAV